MQASFYLSLNDLKPISCMLLFRVLLLSKPASFQDVLIADYDGFIELITLG